MNIDYDKLWEEIDNTVEEDIQKKKKPHEKTVSQLSKHWRTNKKKTLEILDELIASGKMGSREAKSANGVIAKVYFPMHEEK